ncbi:hydroxyacid dehydrogenase [Actinopolymorpha sp. B11F2]|uniref:hydroxyacid dehydrogenase n=1 Tax=Actinopolymorpha sp. B11F2 TaxID=3160862 RepID=UPI0032E41CBE
MTRETPSGVAVLLTAATRSMVLTTETERRLDALGNVRWADGSPDAWDLPELLDGVVACLTGWGTPRLGDDILTKCPDLALVAHSAGSIRNLLPQEAVGTRVTVCQAAALIADSVAEFVIAQILAWLRELHLLDAGLREGAGWSDLRHRHPGRLLGAQTVGVVGASRTGRAVIRLLKAFGSSVLVSDPLLDADEASTLGVAQVDLDTLLARSDIVTLHVPLLPSTRNLLGARELGGLRDGALLVNSARGGLIDPGALQAELRTGRIRAALDVFPAEPLEVDSEWREMPHTIRSPHSAGHTLDSHRRQGEAMVSEIERFLRQEHLHYAVAAGQVDILA